MSTETTTPLHPPPEPTNLPLTPTPHLHHSHPRPRAISSLPTEILYQIFTCLTNATLRHSVNPVCKQWRLISNLLIHRTATWIPVDPTNKKKNKDKNKSGGKGSGRVHAAPSSFHEELLDQLSDGKVDTFECWVLERSRHLHKKLPLFWGHPGLWDEFVSAMHARLMTQRKNHTNGGDINVNVEVKGSGGRLFENIRILNIYGDMVDPKKMILDLKPCFEFLETLKIELLRPSSTTINIFAILDNGPRLKFVEIVVLRDSFVEAVQDDTTATTTIIPTSPATVPIQASVAEEPTSQQKKFYPLQHLIMHGLWIDSVATAERILKTCPDLRVIKSIKIETSNMHSNRTQWESSLMLAASKYLAELARDLCPNLTWYQSDLIYEYQLPKDIRLIELAQIFPEMRTLSMITFEDIGPIATPFRPPYLPAYETPHLSSLINTFLNRLTTLEVISRFYYEVNWTAINRILCLCPLLQHLLVPDIFIITNSISLPSNDTLEDYNNRFYPEEFPWLYDESNKKSRARERAERQHLRELILPVDRNDFNNYPQMSSGRPVPRIWPSRHTLRTLDCSLETSYGLKDFTRHIRAYRLFGHLTVFKIRCVDLKIGQIKACVPSANKKSKSTSQSASSLRRGRLNMSEIRSRYRNDLLALKGLVYLEELVVETARLPGRVVPEDFEFLRRKEPDFGFRFFPAPSISSARTTPSRNKVVEHMDENGDYDVGDHEERESEDSEDENDYGRVEAYKDVETFWPRLTIFHIGYVITHPVNDPKILVPAVEEIRPGVSFRLRLSPNSSKEFF